MPRINECTKTKKMCVGIVSCCVLIDIWKDMPCIAKQKKLAKQQLFTCVGT